MGMFGKKTITAPVQTAPVRPKAMVDLRETAAVSLKKNGLEVDGTGGIAVYLVLDHSGSMQGHYRNGDVQRITEQVLALAVEIDSDGDVPVFYFGTDVSKPVIVSIKNPQSPNYYQGWVDRTHRTVKWGATDYEKTILAVARYHATNGGGQPGLVVFQTDGSPGTWGGGDDRENARQALRDVSGQKLFFSFVGFGDERNVDFLFELDGITGRVRDNASAFHAENPQHTLDSDLYDGILKEFTGDWLPQVL